MAALAQADAMIEGFGSPPAAAEKARFRARGSARHPGVSLTRSPRQPPPQPTELKPFAAPVAVKVRSAAGYAQGRAR